MIHTKIELQAIEETITRPVLVIVATDIKKLLGVNKDIYTVYDVKDNIFKKKNKLGNIRGDNTTRSELMTIEASEASSEDHELALIPIRPDFKPIYVDKDLRAKFQPIYHSRKMSMRVKYFCKSKSKLFSVVNKLRLYTSNDGGYKVHQLIYHYTLPNHIGMLLIELNNLKNKRLLEPLTLTDYINSTFDNRVDLANSIDGNYLKSDLIIRESQIDILGYIQDDLASLQPEYEEESSYWTIEFEYSFTYEKPVTLLLRYPLLVYNTMISKHFRVFEKERKRSKDAYRTARASDLAKLVDTKKAFRIREDNYYLTIPEVDKEELPPVTPYYARMFSVLSIVNEENLRELFNINDIPRIKFRTPVLDFLLNSEFKYVSDRFNSMFYIELYKDRSKDTNRVIMDSDGTLRTEYDMDIKSTYRVMFNVLTDLNFLNKAAYNRVQTYFRNELDTNDPKAPNITQYDNNTLIKTYLNLISVDNNYINKELAKGVMPYDIPFTIQDNRWLQIRTKQIAMVIAYAMEEK